MADVFVPLKDAAKQLGRSVARTRQYKSDGKFGEMGTGWKRDEMGHILVSQAAIAAFTPPERGNARASGIQSGTTLRHFRSSRTFVLKNLKESDRRAAWLALTEQIIGKLADRVKVEKAQIEEVASPASAAVELAVEAAAEIEDEDEEELDEDFDDLVLNL